MNNAAEIRENAEVPAGHSRHRTGSGADLTDIRARLANTGLLSVKAAGDAMSTLFDHCNPRRQDYWQDPRHGCMAGLFAETGHPLKP
ncbi:MAG: hypothetical protein Q7T32_11675 [Moraxellaceae bacterium]|nr:hypothetical protein [Moraxellaceae bacterium]